MYNGCKNYILTHTTCWQFLTEPHNSVGVRSNVFLVPMKQKKSSREISSCYLNTNKKSIFYIVYTKKKNYSNLQFYKDA